MAEITAAAVRTLRDDTSLPMMDCKAALVEAGGDMEKAKDILRAAGLQLLPETKAHVRSDLVKISDAEKLSPILLVRGSAVGGYPLQIADGYHRVCASYLTDENTSIPCYLVSWQ